MRFARLFRWGLVGILVLSLAGVVWSFLSRRGTGDPIPEAELLPPEVSRRTTQFEYTEHKKGRPVYTVYADTSTQTIDRLHTLDQVRLVYYDISGQPADTVSAQQAHYRIEDRQIQFSGDTRVELADGTRIFSEQASADLVREKALISGRFRFEKEDVRGRGEGLRYDFPGQELRIDKGLQLFSNWGAGEMSGQSQRADYRLRDQVLMLLEEARLTDGQNRLDSDRIALHLDENQKLRKILASGQCRLQSGTRLFSGHQIDISFDPNSRKLEWLQVLADTASGSSQRATYSEVVGEVVNRVLADRILGRPNNSLPDGRLSLDGFQAQGDVRLQLPALGIHDSEAGQVEAEYFPGKDLLRLVQLQDGVRVTRSLDSRLGEERLQARLLSLRFSIQQQLEEVWAREDVVISIDGDGSRRDLSARQSVQALYANGQLAKVVGRGDSRVSLEGPEGRDQLRAPVIQINYQNGLLESLAAGPGVESISERQGKVRRTRGDRLEVRYLEGKMESAIQTGDFRFSEGDPAITDLRSERGAFVPRTGKVRATGESPPVLTSFGAGEDGNGIRVETVAQEIELDHETGSVLASGQVRSVVREGENMTIVTSGRMEADPGSSWIVYSIEPRVVQGTSSIAGETVRYNHSGQELVVESNVESRFLRKDTVEEDSYLVEAEKLVYRRQDLKAEYRGKVKVTSGELLVRAPAVDLSLSSSQSDQVEKLTAWGGVTIVDGSRQAFGDRAIHYPTEEKIVLTGDPAEVLEVKKGKAIGRQLTFFVGEERLLVEGAP